MSWFRKRPAAPCPSDILASLVAARMITTPERVTTKLLSKEYGTQMREGRWEDKASGIVVVGKTGMNDAFASSMYGSLQSFCRHGVELAPTHAGRSQLRSALDQCLRHQRLTQEAERQYVGDMAACEGIQDIFVSET